MTTFIETVNANSGAISAIATVAAACIAGVYTWYTTKLWKTTAEQARIADAQVELFQRQLALQEEQMAASTRTFEATTRPRLQIDAEMHRDAVDMGVYGSRDVLGIRARNFGTTLATIVSVDCSFSKFVEASWGIWLCTMLPIVVPPNESASVGKILLPAIPPADLNGNEINLKGYLEIFRWVHLYIDYTGIGESTYHEQAQISLSKDPRVQEHWAVFQITPTGDIFRSIHGLNASKANDE